jgi:hypothetical protein
MLLTRLTNIRDKERKGWYKTRFFGRESLERNRFFFFDFYIKMDKNLDLSVSKLWLMICYDKFKIYKKCKMHKKKQNFGKFQFLSSKFSIFTEKNCKKWTSWGCRIRYPLFIFFNFFYLKQTPISLISLLFC